MIQERIFQALKNRGLNVSMLAEALNVSNQAVFNVIKQGKGSKRIATAIAIAIDTPLDKAFPYYSKIQHDRVMRDNKIDRLKSQFAQINQ
ncbi:DNA-binding protein [Actinobacillus sp. GY-402]|nr:DNA-binding protein [Actinobacillus sp. GY-402]QOF67413.1 DNA-binding protein [Actinobacillus sp. GY-402]